MLVYKASQVVSIAPPVIGKSWEMADEKTGKMRSGISNYAEMTVLSVTGAVAVIRFKGKDEAHVKERVKGFALGKPAEIEVKRMKDSTHGVLVLEA